MTRFYLGNCDFKWTHREDRMADIWVRRQLGEELYKQCNQPGFELHLEYKPSRIVPETYCTCDIWVDVHDSPTATWFALKYPQAEHT